LKTIPEILFEHEYVYGQACCSCGNMWYDHRMMPDKLLVEHRLHVEMELHLAGYGRLAEAWERGYRDCNTEWEQCWDLVTPDEDRFEAINPYEGRQ
jgi:hypothetical protein